MKKAIISLNFLAALTLLNSCNKDIYFEKESSNKMSKQVGLQNYLITNNPFLDNWKTTEEIQLSSGGKPVKLPWSKDATGNFPKEIINTLDKSYGWELIQSTIGTGDVGQNYLLFRNKYTGIVRVFYYMENDITTGDLRTFWRIHFQGTNSLNNNIGTFYIPSNRKKSSSEIEVSTLTLNESVNSIKRGWNVFETEINYDPNINNVVYAIGSFNTQSANITLSGDYNSLSKGDIIRSGTSNPAKTKINTEVNTIGEKAKNWVEGNIVKDSTASKPIKIAGDILGNIASQGVKAIISGGIVPLFGSFIGMFNKQDVSKQEISFSTSGKVNLSGQLTTSGGNNATDWNNISSNPIGVWAIEESPEIIVGKYGLNRGMPPVNGYYQLEKRYYLNNNSIKVTLNQELQSQIVSYSVRTSILYYDKLNGKSDWRSDYTNIEPIINTDERGIIEGQKTLYESSNNVILDAGFGANSYEIVETLQKPLTPFVLLNRGISEKYVIKIQLDFETIDGNKITLSRTMIPKIKLVDNSSNPFILNANSSVNAKDSKILVTFK